MMVVHKVDQIEGECSSVNCDLVVRLCVTLESEWSQDVDDLGVLECASGARA